MIELKNLKKSFGQLKALDDITLTVNDGEIYGVVGFSGAGKSTLVRSINLLEEIDDGCIIVDNVDIKTLKGKSLRKYRQNVAMIFQSFNLLWSRTVFDNIKLPMEIAHIDKEKQNTKALELLKLVGLYDKKDSYPSALSGGQKQRVAIARALTLEPKYLLCDEITSALDPSTANEILDLLKKINQELNVTILMISHQLETIYKIAHKMAVFKEGKVVEEGTVKDLFEHPSHPITKELVRSVEISKDVEKIEEDLKDKYQDHNLLRLSFNADSTTNSVLYTLAKQLDIEFSIISADISDSQKGVCGRMCLCVSKDNDITNFIDQLKQHHVETEVL